jgi:hypothetical protein
LAIAGLIPGLTTSLHLIPDKFTTYHLSMVWNGLRNRRVESRYDLLSEHAWCMNNHLVVHFEFDYASVKYRSWRWLRFIGISAIQSSIIVEDQFDVLQNLRHSRVVLEKTFEIGISRMAKSAG